MTEFTMPSLGADMDRGRVVQWNVGPGDQVRRGDIVALVETEKGIIEVEIWQEGAISELLVEEGSEVPVGTPLAMLIGPAESETEGPTGEAPPPPVRPIDEEIRVDAKLPPPPVRHLAHERGVDLAAVVGSGPGGAITRRDIEAAAVPSGGAAARPKASPRARSVAGHLGVDLVGITGTGPDGLITEADVRAAGLVSGAEPTQPAADQETDPSEERRLAMRRAIAQVMAKSKREIPHYYLGTTIDMTRATTWLAGYNEDQPMTGRILPVVLLLKASAMAIHDVPEMNGFFIEERFQPADAIHLGVAISLRSGGLIAPALHDVDRKSLSEIMTELTDLVARTRTGRLRSSEMSDPTITITNLGDRGVEEGYGVIYAPQVALVCFGKVSERPWAEHGMVGARRVVRVGLSADHRVSDGHRGGLYLEAIDRYLQEPDCL